MPSTIHKTKVNQTKSMVSYCIDILGFYTRNELRGQDGAAVNTLNPSFSVAPVLYIRITPTSNTAHIVLYYFLSQSCAHIISSIHPSLPCRRLPPRSSSMEHLASPDRFERRNHRGLLPKHPRSKTTAATVAFARHRRRRRWWQPLAARSPVTFTTVKTPQRKADHLPPRRRRQRQQSRRRRHH